MYVCILCIDSIYLSIYHLSSIYLWVAGRISQRRWYWSWIQRKKSYIRQIKKEQRHFNLTIRLECITPVFWFKIWSLCNGWSKEMLTWDKSFFLKQDCVFLKYKVEHKNWNNILLWEKTERKPESGTIGEGITSPIWAE